MQDPMLLVKYGSEKNLFNSPGWEWVVPFVPSKEELLDYVKSFKVATKGDGPMYKFGVRVPKSVKEAFELDKINGNKKWEEAMLLEVGQINKYETFKLVMEDDDMEGYKCIPYHMIFDVKFDGRHKARLVAGGHMTNTPAEDCFSGVVSMEAVRLGFIIARMQGLLVCAGDIGNVFLYATTKEKYYVIAGPDSVENYKERN